MEYITAEDANARLESERQEQLRKYPPGFYWVRTAPTEPVTIAEHSSYAHWYVPGVEGPFYEVEVVSERLEEPK